MSLTLGYLYHPLSGKPTLRNQVAGMTKWDLDRTALHSPQSTLAILILSKVRSRWKPFERLLTTTKHQSWTFFSPASYRPTQPLPLAVYTARCCWFRVSFNGYRVLCLGCTTTRCSRVFLCYDGTMSDFWRRDSHMVTLYTHILISPVELQVIHISPLKCPSREEQHRDYKRVNSCQWLVVQFVFVKSYHHHHHHSTSSNARQINRAW